VDTLSKEVLDFMENKFVIFARFCGWFEEMRRSTLKYI
jgi:hypothetical protein